MWTFEQQSGKLFDPSGNLIGVGYSGHGEGLNAPGFETIADVGPLPAGLYTVEEPIDSATHGPFALPLNPDPANHMFGRDDFLMHGDSVTHAGQRVASLGCIIMSRDVREAVWASSDHELQVVPLVNPIQGVV